MFNLLVSGNYTAWETDQLMRMPRDRFGEYSDTERARISLDQMESVKSLEGIDTLLMYEMSEQNTPT
jgi:hypothetical protein